MSVFTGTLGQWSQTARTLWDWWRRELWDAVPTSIKARLRGRARVDIYLRDSRVEMLCTDRDLRFQLCEDAPLSVLTSESWDEISKTLVDRSARLFLRDRDVLYLELDVPRRAGRDLPSAIAIQLELASPLSPALCTWSWAATKVDRERAEVLVALVRSSTLEVIDKLFLRHGLVCPPIYCETAPGNLRLQRGRSVFESLYRRWQRLAIIWSTALFVSLPLLVLAGASLLTAIEQAKLDGLRREAAPKLASLREARRDARLWQVYIPLRAIPPATLILSELGERAPAQTSVENIDFHGGRSIAFDWTGDVSAQALDDFVRSPGKVAIERPEADQKLTSPLSLSAELE